MVGCKTVVCISENQEGFMMSDGKEAGKFKHLHLVLTILAVVAAIGGVVYQGMSQKNARKQLREASRQAGSAEVQAKAALLQNRLSNVDRFREHMKAMSQALNLNPSEVIDENSKPYREMKVVTKPRFSHKELERTDTSVRFEEVVKFVRETKIHTVREVLNNTLLRMSDLPSMVVAISSYESAVALESEVSDKISAMEYVLLASYSHALAGVPAAEKFVNRALVKLEGKAANFQKVLLYTTLAQLYYMHSPELSSKKGSEYYEKAADALPKAGTAGVLDFSVWSEWIIAEYTVGREESGKQREQEAEKAIRSMPVSQSKRRRMLINFWKEIEMARIKGKLKTGGPYSLGVKTMAIEEYDRSPPVPVFNDENPVPPAPAHKDDDSVVLPAPVPSDGGK